MRENPHCRARWNIDDAARQLKMPVSGQRSVGGSSAVFFRRFWPLVCCALALALTGCGDYSGGSAGFGPIDNGDEDGENAQGIDGAPAFQQTVFPILRDQCSDCHAGSGPGTPHLAHSDFETAYRAVLDNQKANLASPGSSRLVQRLAVDFHYCWGGCVENGAEMSAAIGQWAVLVNFESGITTLDGVIAGSSRDWAAKGPFLQGVRFVVAESYERIHRSNLVGMGILPLEFPTGQSAESLGLDGTETIEVQGLTDLFAGAFKSGRTVHLVATKDTGTIEFDAPVRIDTPQEAEYYKNGGILQYVLRNLART